MKRRNFIQVLIGSSLVFDRVFADQGDAEDIQTKIDRTHRRGGGTIFLPPGRFVVNNSIKVRPNVALIGCGPETVFVAGRPAMRVFDEHGGPAAGFGGISKLRVEGYGKVLPTRGTERDRAVVLGPFARGWCREVEISGSRWVSLSCKGENFHVSHCHISNGFRDGIQMYDVRRAVIEKNIIENVADDAISCMTPRGSVGVSASDTTSYTIIRSNYISNCTGIKVLGRSNVYISENKSDFCYGYSVFLGVDLNFKEGLISMNNVNINGNVFRNTVSLSEVSDNSGVAGIYYSGSDGREGDDGHPIVISNVDISRNEIIQDVGKKGVERELWWIDGAIRSKNIVTVVKEGGDIIRGIYFKRGLISSLKIYDNTLSGFAESILFEKNNSLSNIDIRHNIIENSSRDTLVPEINPRQSVSQPE